MSIDQEITLKQIIPPSLNGLRLDIALARLFPQYSRAQLQTWIKTGKVYINQKVCSKRNQCVSVNQTIKVSAKTQANEQWQPQEIALEIVYEDTDIIVVNKPAGLVTHPGAGNKDKTLVNALLHHHQDLAKLPRAGIIHRLDKDTSGLLLTAKTIEAYNSLSKAMHDRAIKREYLALIKGTPISGKTIEAPIARHPIHRTRMAVSPHGRPAVTHFCILEKFNSFSLIRVQLETGRTHQIRAHMLHIHHPIVGDKTYGKHIGTPYNLKEEIKLALKNLHRQALHAESLTFLHPISHKKLEFHAPLPKDIQELLNALREPQLGV